MAKTPKLKVFATPIGFHDAYVAAPSRAAALRAWGSDHDLFARGAAVEVTEPALMAAPLARPGEVIRRLRGTDAEQFAALPPDPPASTGARPRHAPDAPRPSAGKRDEAEARLQAAIERHRDEDAAATARIEAAQRDRGELRRRHRAEADRLRDARDAAQAAYDDAVRRWRSGER